jgi:hypothetical protein
VIYQHFEGPCACDACVSSPSSSLQGHPAGCACKDCAEFRSYKRERERQQRLTREALSGRPEYPVLSAEEAEEVRRKLQESAGRLPVIFPDTSYAVAEARRDQAALQRARENTLPGRPRETGEEKAMEREREIARNVPDDSSLFWTGSDHGVLERRLDVDLAALRSWQAARQAFAATGNELDLDLMLDQVTMTVPPLASDVSYLLEGERIAREAPGQDRRVVTAAIVLAVFLIILVILHFALGG